MNGVSTKVSAATLGAALSTLVWTLLAAFVHAVSTMSPEALTGVTGATAVLAAFGFGFFVKETATSTASVPSLSIQTTGGLVSSSTGAPVSTPLTSGYLSVPQEPAEPGPAWDDPSNPPSEDAL